MQTADFNVEDFDSREAGDKTVYVKFYVKPVRDEDASVAEGRPIYKDKEYIEIRVPGNQTNVVQRPVSDMDRRRFRTAYEKFKEGETEQTIGTPLTEVGWITRSQVEELSYLRIRTLEHLAEVGDDVCSRMPGMYKLKQRAQQAVAKSEKDAPFLAIQQKNEEMANRMAAMEQTIAEQSAIIQKLNAASQGKAAK